MKVLQEQVRKTDLSLKELTGALLKQPKRDETCRRCILVRDVGFFLLNGTLPQERELATEVLIGVLTKEEECCWTRSDALYFLSQRGVHADPDVKKRLRAFRANPENAGMVERADRWFRVA